MIGIHTRLPGVKCEIGTCLVEAAYTENIIVIPGSRALRNERHSIDIVLCRRHDDQFNRDGLSGTITAYGDEIARELQ